MHYIGLDLAWGERKPTGVAVLDSDGLLLQVSAATDDDSVLDALAGYRNGPVLVAIDAPLVVVNASGNRPAEAALNADFARFDAGAHPVNTGKPEFAGTPRGARLAAALGLDLNPRSRRDRRAIEVYPHPATIVLFGLERTLKYKNKPGRTAPMLRAALLTLIRHIESLADAQPPLLVSENPAWAALVTAVERAERKSELRVVEDQVDAVLCAYIARYVDANPRRITIYGDQETGCIVTPSLPGKPSPRRDLVERAVQSYAAMQPTLVGATEHYVDLVTGLLDDAGINYLTVTGRTKSVASFAGKATRTVDGKLLYSEPLTEITDQIGVRVITYVLSDVQAVAELLADQLRVLDDRDMGQETAKQGRFGYSSRHMLVQLDERRAADPGSSAMADRTASVQVRTVLQHAWAEFEHDIRYKGTIPAEHTSDFDRRFSLAAGLLELADREFSTIRDRLRASMSGPGAVGDGGAATDPRIVAGDLAAFLAGRFPDAGWSRTEHYAWVSGLLLELGITSLEELGGLLNSVDSVAISEQMDYRYPPGAVRRLDDALLAVFTDRYVQLHGNADRIDAVRSRLAKLRG